MNPNLNILGKSPIIRKKINDLIFELKRDDIDERITWK
jgi:hypothetical protein